MYCDWKDLRPGDECTMCDGVTSINVRVLTSPDGCLVAVPVGSFLAGFMGINRTPIKIADVAHNVTFRFDAAPVLEAL